MNRLEKGELSRRERQLLDILYRLGEAYLRKMCKMNYPTLPLTQPSELS
jgi:hypothetical protein